MKNGILFLIFFISLSLIALNAQSDTPRTIKIKGIVKTAEGLPIHNGYVFVDSLKTGYRTNKKGEYKLRIPIKTNILSIYAEQYGLQSEVYNGEKEVNFVFPKNIIVLERAELTKLGYIFDVEVFRNIGKKNYAEYTDIFQIIREKFTGVTVNGTSIIVRGYIGGDQTPLFIVDGSYVSSIDYINPIELKSIELLKGEDTTLYGVRGAAGVFIISLK